MALLEVDGVSKRFGGVAANTDISFGVAEGEILGLIGPNGAGKTSLFNSIAGEVVPDTGAIRLGGRAISGAGPVACARAGVGRTFQVVRSFETMSVLENTMVGAFLRHGRAAAARAKAMDVLGFCGLADIAGRMAGELSPPQKRRLEVARALATEPKLLLLDEMLTGLTPTEAQEGVALVRAVRERGITIIMVEHVMEILLPLIDRAVVLDLGRVLTIGLPTEIVHDSRVIAAYLGDKYRPGDKHEASDKDRAGDAGA
jgi:branched-chain amino acid transport system ATP-binding protein